MKVSKLYYLSRINSIEKSDFNLIGILAISLFTYLIIFLSVCYHSTVSILCWQWNRNRNGWKTFVVSSIGYIHLSCNHCFCLVNVATASCPYLSCIKTAAEKGTRGLHCSKLGSMWHATRLHCTRFPIVSRGRRWTVASVFALRSCFDYSDLLSIN